MPDKTKLKVTLTFHIEVTPTDYDSDNANIAADYVACMNDNPELVDFLIEKEFEIAAEVE
jgi:hypothetical protein